MTTLSPYEQQEAAKRGEPQPKRVRWAKVALLVALACFVVASFVLR